MSNKNAKIKRKIRILEIENYAKLRGISFKEAEDEIENRKKQTSKLYSKGLKPINSEIKEKVNNIHKLTKFDRKAISIVQGGAPGLGKKK